MVDKNLFLYDLAVVCIMKNEEPYVKEWFNYHLLAGADHFYIYDNDSTPEFKKILQPYIDAGIVTYTLFSGKVRQLEAYFDVVKRFKFQSRYISWIDGDEFIFPKTKTISEVVDDILADKPNVGGIAVNIHQFGSNGHEKADYSKGVLDRFTARASDEFPESMLKDPKGRNAGVSTIANPRRILYFPTPHAPAYMYGCYACNEDGGVVPGFLNYPVTAKKIAMNHYHTKSLEEWGNKCKRGNADGTNSRTMEGFKSLDFSDVFDDEIIKYRDARYKALIPTGGVLTTSFNKKR